MSASWLRVLGLMIVSAWLADGCSKGITIRGSGGASGGGGTGGSVSSSRDASDALLADALGSTGGTTGSGGAPGTGGSSGLDAPIGAPPADFTQTDHIDLGAVLVGASVSGKVTITATTQLIDLFCSVSSAGNMKPDPATTTCPTAAPGPLAAGASCFFGFIFGPSTAGVKTGDEITCSAGSVAKFTSVTALVVTAAKLVIAPTAAQTAASTGRSNTVTFTVANGGGSPTGTITAAITPPNPEFVVSGTTCTAGLLPLGTCTVTVTYTPTTDGGKTATLVVTDSDAPADVATATVTGVGGVSALIITGGPNLGTVALGEVGTPVTFTIKNINGTDATGVVVMTNNPAFVLGNDGCTGMTLAKMTGTCTVTLTFAPSKDGLPGAYNGLLTVSSGPSNPFNLPITATAVKPAADGGVIDSGDASDGGGTGDGPKPDAAAPDGP